MQVAHSHCTALYSVQACLRQQANEVLDIEITVVMKMIKKAPLPLCGRCEIDGQHPSAGLQNSSHFVSTLQTSVATQMMKHDRGQYRIELTVGKRQGFDDAILEDNLGTSLIGFLTPRASISGDASTA